ncbi:putative RNA exonuclease 4 [Blattamonas nauphoetae]|uniref:RNA exonuclease 4 n=1 Tax=Blattamonas nauphoetae TaxID=2049346 RepID=A0ABQ9Y2R9_9EUKA|nr:putative RNA exonuclease 4 [Blattamonas nauphoetae]
MSLTTIETKKKFTSPNWDRFKKKTTEKKLTALVEPQRLKTLDKTTAHLLTLCESVLSRPQKDILQISGTPDITPCIAIDCEMVGVGRNGKQDALARVSIVNYYGSVILDSYIHVEQEIVDFRTEVSGIRKENLKNAPPFSHIQRKVAKLLDKRTLVGHSVSNDLKILRLEHPRELTRDVYKCHYLRDEEGITGSLKALARRCLGIDIQEGEHSSIIDAQAAMALYRLVEDVWEERIARDMKTWKEQERQQIEDEEVMDDLDDLFDSSDSEHDDLETTQLRHVVKKKKLYDEWSTNEDESEEEPMDKSCCGPFAEKSGKEAKVGEGRISEEERIVPVKRSHSTRDEQKTKQQRRQKT